MPALRTLLAILLIALAWGLAGCGSDSSGTTSESSRNPGAGAANGETSQQATKEPEARAQDRRKPTAREGKKEAVPEEPAHFTPPSHQDSGGGAKQFVTKGGDNSIQEFGSEPSGSEFEAAAAAVHAYLDARAAGAWAAACEWLAPAVSRELVRQLGAGSGGKQPGCAEVLAGLSAGVPPAALREAAQADVGALRVEGDRGFVLFRGAQGDDYFIPMVREDGEWKVAAIAASPLL
jgi:hypothetical protein